jgi:hypothetical protein
MSELERELEGLKREMEKVADHLEDNEDVLDGAVNTDTAYSILRSLLMGKTAEVIIKGYGLEVAEHGV